MLAVPPPQDVSHFPSTAVCERCPPLPIYSQPLSPAPSVPRWRLIATPPTPPATPACSTPLCPCKPATQCRRLGKKCRIVHPAPAKHVSATARAFSPARDYPGFVSASAAPVPHHTRAQHQPGAPAARASPARPHRAPLVIPANPPVRLPRLLPTRSEEGSWGAQQRRGGNVALGAGASRCPRRPCMAPECQTEPTTVGAHCAAHLTLGEARGLQAQRLALPCPRAPPPPERKPQRARRDAPAGKLAASEPSAMSAPS